MLLEHVDDGGVDTRTARGCRTHDGHAVSTDTAVGHSVAKRSYSCQHGSNIDLGYRCRRLHQLCHIVALLVQQRGAHPSGLVTGHPDRQRL